MKYLFIVLFLIGCGGNDSKPDIEPVAEVKPFDYPFQQVEMQGLDIHDMNTPQNAGGIVTRSGDDWRFDSHKNFDCIDVLKGWCRKADVGFTEGESVTGRYVKYTFTFNVIEYNEEFPPEWVILYQDWVRIIDGLSNHPMTTLKLVYDNGVNICGYNNSWQLDWDKPDWGHVSDGSIHDHPPEELMGCAKIGKDEFIDVDFIISDSGTRALFIDGKEVFINEGRTKHESKPHIYSFGLYWSKGYNLEYDASKKISVKIDQFKRFEFIE